MKSLLRFIGWCIGLFGSFLLTLFLVLTIVLTALSMTLTNRNNLKMWLKSSTLYENAKSLVIESMIQIPTEGTKDSSATEESYFAAMGKRLQNSNDDFTKLINKIVTPQYLESTLNTVIDATYDWLEKKTENLDFTIKIVENKADFVEFLAITFREKAKQLPACPKNFKVTAKFEPLGTSCWPRGMSYNEINKFIDKNSNRPEFQELFNKTGFSSEAFKIPLETSQQVQRIYVLVRFLPLLVIVVVLVLSGLCILFIPSKRGAVVIVGLALLFPGILWLVGALSGVMSTKYIFSNISDTVQSAQFVLLSPYLKLLVEAVLSSFKSRLFLCIGTAIAMGALLIVVGTISFRKPKAVTKTG